jgi:hypothetical protein
MELAGKPDQRLDGAQVSRSAQFRRFTDFSAKHRAIAPFNFG